MLLHKILVIYIMVVQTRLHSITVNHEDTLQDPRHLSYLPGTKLVANAHALLLTGSAMWSARFSSGPLPVTMA